MSPKVKAPIKNGKNVKASAPKSAPVKSAKADNGKKSVKATAKTAPEAVAAAPQLNPDGSPVDLDELEEQQDAAAASGESSNAAALAAATGGSTEMSASFKNFRHHPDMENFYRFIFENDLRHEALAIIDNIMVEKQQRRLAKGPTKSAH